MKVKILQILKSKPKIERSKYSQMKYYIISTDSNQKGDDKVHEIGFICKYYSQSCVNIKLFAVTGQNAQEHVQFLFISYTVEAAVWRCSQERCSKNMQQIYRGTPMPKCNFNKVAKQNGRQSSYKNIVGKPIFNPRLF